MKPRGVLRSPKGGTPLIHENIGEDEALEKTSYLNEDFERRTVRINCDSKKIRGKDFSCTPKIKRGIFYACSNIKLYFQVTHLK